MVVMKRWARVVPFFLIGPISGPMLAGVIFNYREGRPVLSSLYAIALAEYVILLPALTVHFGLMIK